MPDIRSGKASTCPGQTMASSSFQLDLKKLLRFYRFSLPHWKLVLVAFAAMLVYTAVNVNSLILVKPAIDALQSQEQAAGPPRERNQPQEEAAVQQAGRAPFTEVPPDELLDTAEKRFKKWLLAIGPIAAARQWFYTGDQIKKIALVLACVLAPLLFVSGFAHNYVSRRVVWHIMGDVRIAVFERLSSLSLTYFARQRTGELVSRLTNDINTTRNVLKLIFGRIMQEPLKLMGFFAVALFFSWEVTLISSVCFPLLVLVQARYGRRIRRHSQKNLERLADITDSITQMLQGIRVVKAFNREEQENQQFSERTWDQLKRAFKLVRTRAWADVLPEFLIVLALALLMVVAGGLVARGKLEVSGMFACVAALAATSGPIRRLVKCYNDLQESMAGVTRLFELLDTEPEIYDRPGAVELEGVTEGVSFRNVWFAYDDEPVLRGIDLFVPCGKMYAIVGETGAGKSTMLDLIPRFYDVTDGSVSIDGLDVRDVKRKSLMHQISIVGQHPFLFNRTIAENIGYARQGATMEQIVTAAKAANIHDFIKGLPEGYQTMAGERGGRFSGGQRQCITIARAILKNAPILILDEATSNLDAESEMLVQMALSNLMEGRTTFVIAHRLSTVRHADQIVVLKEGRVLEQGSHEELLEKRGEYERLYRLQFLETPDDRAEDAELPGL